MKIYHNPRCRKSRDTLQILKESGIEPEIIDYLKNAPEVKELNDILEKLQISPEQLVRKGEKLYKEQFKGRTISDQEWLQILSSNPVLIERPIVIAGEKAVIGRPPENVKKLL